VIDRDGVIVRKSSAPRLGAPVNENLIRRLIDAR